MYEIGGSPDAAERPQNPSVVTDRSCAHLQRDPPTDVPCRGVCFAEISDIAVLLRM